MNREQGRRAYTAGIEAEARALAYLQQQGFTCIAERYRNAYGEIDLIVGRKDELRFVEVKLRAKLTDSLHALSERQQKRLWQCAQGFLAEQPSYAQYAMQFDLIAIAGFHLEHIEHILSES